MTHATEPRKPCERFLRRMPIYHAIKSVIMLLFVVATILSVIK